jgi:hypothetical protein
MTETLERSQLRQLVDALPDEVVVQALDDLRLRYEPKPQDDNWPPAFFNLGPSRSGRTDIATDPDKYLSDGFGQR